MSAARQARLLGELGVTIWVPRAPAAAVDQPPAQPLAPGARSGEISSGRSGAGELPRMAPPGGAEGEGSVPSAAAAAAVPGEVPDASWEALEARVRTCTRCPLHATRTRTVFGMGSREARLMIVGEAPGANEDRAGLPFVGRAGALLDAMLLAIGLQRDEVYIANTLKCRPPSNRDPRPEETERCRGFLEAQIELLGPAVILAVGAFAARWLLGSELPVGRLRGRVHRYREETPVVVTYHPAYYLRSPGQKRRGWEDLLLVHSLLQGGETPGPGARAMPEVGEGAQEAGLPVRGAGRRA